ncbi:hypothetical protein [Catellatospora vulcania]|uniref:hypothetical protein n=1 Tax=Catellatospora vulcania TaxID=1460450 RepID=UPI0012D37E4A|nr:hypothetical protein [Catellatospora vulcania]
MPQPQSSFHPSMPADPPNSPQQPSAELPLWVIGLLGLALGGATTFMSFMVTVLIHSMLAGDTTNDLLDSGYYTPGWHATLAVVAVAIGGLVALAYGGRRAVWIALLGPLLFWAFTSTLRVLYSLDYRQHLPAWTLIGVALAPISYALAAVLIARLPLSVRRATALRTGVVVLSVATIAASAPMSAALPTLRREHDFAQITFAVAYPAVAGYEPTIAHMSADRRTVSIWLNPVEAAGGERGQITVTVTANDGQGQCGQPSGWLLPSPAPGGQQPDPTCRSVAPDRWQSGSPDQPMVFVGYRNSWITFQSPSEPPVAAGRLLTAELRELTAADLAAIAY